MVQRANFSGVSQTHEVSVGFVDGKRSLIESASPSCDVALARATLPSRRVSPLFREQPCGKISSDVLGTMFGVGVIAVFALAYGPPMCSSSPTDDAPDYDAVPPIPSPRSSTPPDAATQPIDYTEVPVPLEAPCDPTTEECGEDSL